MSGTLFVVGTPIGNLDDVTIRAAEVLRAVGVCYAEDTRRTRKLLDHLGARTPIKSLHQHNEQARVEEILKQLLPSPLFRSISGPTASKSNKEYKRNLLLSADAGPARTGFWAFALLARKHEYFTYK